MSEDDKADKANRCIAERSEDNARCRLKAGHEGAHLPYQYGRSEDPFEEDEAVWPFTEPQRTLYLTKEEYTKAVNSHAKRAKA